MHSKDYIGVFLLHILLPYDTLYYRLVSLPAYKCFLVLILFLIVVCISDGKTVVKLTEETQLILGEVTRQLNLEKLLPTYRYVVSVR